MGIYYAIRFVRRTRGAPVVWGFLVVLLSLGLVSYLLKLRVLQYFLGGFSAFFVLAVLVIFQPELRRMLAELCPLARPRRKRPSCSTPIFRSTPSRASSSDRATRWRARRAWRSRSGASSR